MNKRTKIWRVALAAAVTVAATAAWAEEPVAADTAVPAAETTPLPREWTLAECVGLALENNLDYRMVQLDRRVAALEVEVTRGGYDPGLSLSAKRSHEETLGEAAGTAEGLLATTRSETDSDAFAAGVKGITPFYGLSYEVGAQAGSSDGVRAGNPFDTTDGSIGVTLTQPLLKGFKTGDTRYRVATAEKQSAEAALRLEEQLQSLLAEVEGAWYSLAEARESVAAQEEAVRLAERLYEDNRQKVRIGAMSRLDEKQAESQAAAARAEWSSAQQNRMEAENRLKALVFADQRRMRGVRLEFSGGLAAEEVTVDVEESSVRALEGRPELREARLALERQGLTVDYQHNQTLPSLELTGGYGLTAGDEDSYGSAWDRISAADEPYWTAGVTLTVPLGNREARNRYHQSLATQEKLRLQLAQAEETALVEVENAVSAVRTGWEKIGATRAAREYAGEALEAEQKKLASGQSTSFVVLQLQKNLTAARQAEIAARADYNRQLSTLARAEGTMLERHHVELSTETE